MRPLKDLPTNREEIAGEYVLPHPTVKEYFFCATVTILDGWECIGVGVRKRPQHSKNKLEKVPRTLTYDELTMVKNLFWKDEEVVIMFIPPYHTHLFDQKFVTYLWKPLTMPLPLPAPIMELLKIGAKETVEAAKAEGSEKEFDQQQRE